jgi:hypothetical protein
MKIYRLGVMAFAVAMVLWMVGAAHADGGGTLTREAQAAITPDKAIEMLKEGNQRFVSDNTVNRDLLAQVKQTANGQFQFGERARLPALGPLRISCGTIRGLSLKFHNLDKGLWV